MLGNRYIVSTVAGERSVSNRFCCRKRDPVGDAGALGVELGVLDPGRVEIDTERPRAEPARGDGDAAVAGPEVDHVVGGADLGDLQHAVHGLARGRDIDDVETLRVDIGDGEDADADQERGREHSSGDGRSSGLTHTVLVAGRGPPGQSGCALLYLRRCLIIRFCRLAPRKATSSSCAVSARLSMVRARPEGSRSRAQARSAGLPHHDQAAAERAGLVHEQPRCDPSSRRRRGGAFVRRSAGSSRARQCASGWPVR